MNDLILARYDLDAEELIRALESHARCSGAWANRPQRQRQAWIIAVMALFAAFALTQTRDSRWWFALLALSALVLFLFSPEWTWSLQKLWLRFQQGNKPPEHCAWSITSQGFAPQTSEGAQAGTPLAWDAVKCVVEIDGHFLVYPRQGPFIWLPRGAFAHNAADRFRDLTRSAGKLWARTPP